MELMRKAIIKANIQFTKTTAGWMWRIYLNSEETMRQPNYL